MTIRSEGQFNTVVYDEEDLYRGNSTRDVVMLNAVDAALLSVHEGDTVEVTSSVGSMSVRAGIVDIARGCLAMYYPEANQLVAALLDAESRTPAFKSVPVTIRKV
jgi:anaerobic selenocysteine-containing dehydrogenase